MGVKKTITGRMPTLNPTSVADLIAVTAIGMVQRRTAKGQGLDGPFAGYSSSYRAALTRGGESTRVDLAVTGHMLSDFVHTIETRGGNTVVVVGLGSATSEARSFQGGAARKTGRRSPPHNVLGRYIHRGTPRMPPRPFMGLTRDERIKIRDLVAKGILRRRG